MWVGTFPSQIPTFGITMEFSNFWDDTPCSFIDTDLSKTYILSIFRVVYIEVGVNTFLFLKKSEKRFFETLLLVYQTTRRHTPEDTRNSQLPLR